MGLILLNKLLILCLWLSVFNVIKEITLFLVNLLVTDQPSPWVMSDKKSFLLGISLSYIMLCIFNGITI